MNLTVNEAEKSSETRGLIRHMLEKSAAVNLRDISRAMQVDQEEVVREMRNMVYNHEVEEMVPYGMSSSDTDPCRIYYRLIRPSDLDHEWEQEIVQRIPAGRIVKEMAKFEPADSRCVTEESVLSRLIKYVNTRNRHNMRTTRKMAAALSAVLIAGAAMAQDKIVVDGSTTVGPIAKAFAEYYMQNNPGVNITVSESGSGNGAKSLMNNACDVATMSRAMKDKEKSSAKEAGINVIAHVVAMDGLALVVHESNPVKALTVEQVRDIYTGKIANWKEIGGPDKKIVVISRDTNSGTYESFETLVMDKKKMSGSTEYVGSNGAIRQRVLSTDAAIGYVGLAFTEGVKILTINGITPTAETVLDKTYPVARALYMYTNGRPKDDSNLGKFVNLYKSQQGRKIIEDIGFVPVEVK